ncbi:MAG: hypothetical protein IPK22_11220 [Verrucomicrobiaceae bacterium]|nr:hypothetical protein [Verrucomicrobiaceae bacterium]
MKGKYYVDTGRFVPVTCKENKDGTFDLTNPMGELIVTSCPASDEPKVGHVVLTKEKPAKDEKSKDGGK